MDRRYLLTYDKEISILGHKMYSIKTYEWFEDEEEMNMFIEDYDIVPIEKVYIADGENL
jgi:hypothetical protein